MRCMRAGRSALVCRIRRIRVERWRGLRDSAGMEQISVRTQFGALCVTAEGGVITRLAWGEAAAQSGLPLLREAARQLTEYDQGVRRVFDLVTKVNAAPLTQAVCAVMQRIPHGETLTYGEIASRVGASAQAVGQACGKNPIPVIIPCHRVMGAGGKLTGFSGGGGVETKVALLRHEHAAGLLI